jgi:hypothetical protein
LEVAAAAAAEVVALDGERRQLEFQERLNRLRWADSPR